MLAQFCVAGDDWWAQLDVVDRIMHHAGTQVGPVREGLVEQVVKVPLGSEMVWVWTPERPMVNAPPSWLNVMKAGDARKDETMGLLWSTDIKVGTIEPIRDRMEGRGGDQWDWYITPAGVLDRYFRSGQQEWENGVGARKVCSLPAAKAEGE